MQPVSLCVLNYCGSLSAAFSFSPPVITSFRPSNFPSLQDILVTVQGQNFGYSGSLLQLEIGGRTCSPSWMSSSEVLCSTTNSVSRNAGSTALTVDGQASSSAAFIAIDRAVITSITPINGPTTGATIITIAGIGMGAQDLSPASYIGSTKNAVTRWLSSTSVLSYTAGGYPGPQNWAAVEFPAIGTSALDAVRVPPSTAEFKFKFDAAVATAVLPAVLSRTPGATVTIFGRNFGMGSNVPSSNSVLLNSPRYSAGTLFDSSNSQHGTAIPTALPIATLSPNLVDSMSSSARTTIGYVYLTLDAVLHQFSDTQRASVAAAIAAWLQVDDRIVTADVLPGSVIIRACVNGNGYDGAAMAVSLLGAFSSGALRQLSGYTIVDVSIDQPPTVPPTIAPTLVPLDPYDTAAYTFPPTGAGDCSGIVEIQTTAGAARCARHSRREKHRFRPIRLCLLLQGKSHRHMTAALLRWHSAVGSSSRICLRIT
jgi:hypothetical protein